MKNFINSTESSQAEQVDQALLLFTDQQVSSNLLCLIIKRSENIYEHVYPSIWRSVIK